MNGTAFDSMTRRFAMRLSRRRLLSSTALGAVAAIGLKAGQSGSLAQSDASALVQRFYENIDAF
jgi:hypothetical protein